MEDITFNTLLLSQNEKVCYIDKEEVVLTPTEYELLLFMLSNRNKIYSREELVKAALNKSVSERAIDTNIVRLRKKLKEYGNNIITRRGFGYGFKEEVN